MKTQEKKMKKFECSCLIMSRSVKDTGNFDDENKGEKVQAKIGKQR